MFLWIKQSTTAWVALGVAFLAMASPAAAQSQTRTTRVRTQPRVEATAPRTASGTSRPTTYGFSESRPVSYQTTMARSPRVMRTSMQEEMVVEDEGVYEEVSEHAGVSFSDCGCGGGGCDDCSGCDSCGVGGCNSCADGCLVPCPQLTFRNMEFFVGVEGFKGPVNRGRDGSFGFNEGANLGFGLPCMTNDFLSAQIGVNAVQSNFAGADFTDENREQFFVTGGLFRRVDYGLQGGAVVDYLHETWNTERNVAQVRGLLSWAYAGGDELGFQFTSAIQDDFGQSLVDGVAVNETWTPTETFLFFYRHTFDECSGSNGRILAGFSGESDAYLGADWWTPLNDRWALNGNFAYLIPEDNQNPAGSINESWNVGMNLVWYPGGLARYRSRYNRPMFNVADNGSMFMTVQ